MGTINGLINWFKLYLITLVRGNDIRIKLPKSTRVSHYAVGCVIPKGVKFGENCLIRQGLTIGQRYAPRQKTNNTVIGDRVIFGANVTILGDVTIGDDVNIGGGSIILKDVPSKTRVVGVWR